MARRIPKPKNKPNFGNKAKRRKLIEHNLKVLKEGKQSLFEEPKAEEAPAEEGAEEKKE